MKHCKRVAAVMALAIASGWACAQAPDTTRLPSLWFYGDNDSYFDPGTFRAMHEQYTAAGGKARLVAFGMSGSDAHGLFGSRAGGPIWQPEVSSFLASIGMPNAVQPAFERYGARASVAVPQVTWEPR